MTSKVNSVLKVPTGSVGMIHSGGEEAVQARGQVGKEQILVGSKSGRLNVQINKALPLEIYT
jgi:hypothetical protein